MSAFVYRQSTLPGLIICGQSADSPHFWFDALKCPVDLLANEILCTVCPHLTHANFTVMGCNFEPIGGRVDLAK